MSTLLSTISRQCAPSIRIEFHVHFDHLSVPMPSICGGLSSGRRRRPFGVVPHHQLAVDLQRLPLAGAGQLGDAAGVGNLRAPAGRAVPAPVVERAGDVVALDRAHRQVSAQVPAVAVEHVDVALGVGVDHQLAAERLDAVRLAVAEVIGQAQAVPTAREPRHRRAGVDLPDLGSCGASFSLWSEQSAPRHQFKHKCLNLPSVRLDSLVWTAAPDPEKNCSTRPNG